MTPTTSACPLDHLTIASAWQILRQSRRTLSVQAAMPAVSQMSNSLHAIDTFVFNDKLITLDKLRQCMLTTGKAMNNSSPNRILIQILRKR